MTLPPQTLALFCVVSFLVGLLTGGIIMLAFAMRLVKREEGVGYDR